MAREILISSPDEKVVHRLRTALHAHGLVVAGEAAASPPSLGILHRNSDAVSIAHEVDALGAPAIVLVDNEILGTAVELMGASDRIIGVFDATAFDDRELTYLAKRAVGGARFALAPVVAADAAVQTTVVRDHDGKLACLASIRASAQDAGLPMLLIDAIDQCVDEMLMNALYDAVIDGSGRRPFEGLPTRKRIARRTDRDVTVEYAGTNGRFTVAVRDTFGSLKRDVVLRHLHKGLHAEHKIDRKVGGAGLGLFLMASAASTLSFTIAPTSATEVRCTFRKDQLTKGQLELVEIAADAPAAGARPARVLRTPAARRQLVDRCFIAAAVIVLPFLALLPPLGPPEARFELVTQPVDAVVEIDGRVIERGKAMRMPLGQTARVRAVRDGYDAGEVTLVGDVNPRTVTITLLPVATLEVDSHPPDAAVVIDGAPAGSTPLTLTSLRPQAAVTVTFDKPGYSTATSRLTVPARGQRLHQVQTLVRDPALVPVRLESIPPGALVLRDGARVTSERTYTPADVFVPRSSTTRFQLEMPGRVPAVIDVAPTAGDSDITKHVELAVAP